ncbi:MAG: 3-methyl-2-oxobutanoate hydroxymethyltransferase [Saccharofermentanales bacterium]
MKRTILTFNEAKSSGRKLTMLTAYDYSTARLVDACDIDGILVGDSLGMVCLGYKDTLSVTMDDMIHHIKAVSRGVVNALLVGDMPFMSYQISAVDAVRNAGRLVQEAGAEAVKIEGSDDVIEQVRAIVKAQIPVMGHIGLTPQSVNMFGGFKVQGRETGKAKQLIEDAKKLVDAGVFAIVLECIPMELAARITETVSVPTIGIGAGNGCSGQVLVYHDMFGMYPNVKPKFVKTYENVEELIKSGIRKYVDEVCSGTFPDEEHSFTMDITQLD